MGDEPAAPVDAAAITGGGFKKRVRKDNGRARKTGAGLGSGDAAAEGDGEGGSAVVRVVKARKESALGASTATRKEEVNVHQREVHFSYASERTVQQANDGGATRQLEQETATDRDGRALREQVLAQQAEGAVYDASVYKGMNNYKDYRAGFRKEHTISSEKSRGAHGPLRANTTIRGTFIMDYKPDICKDYKETGYCGFGDACKFMHDRGDYKSGWELDREWEEKEKERKRAEALKMMAGSDDEEEEEDDGLPFACFICRTNFLEVKDPVMTKCKHYYCEHCALKHYQKDKTCFVCNEPTGGVFNVAKDILAKTKAKAKADADKAAGKEPQDDGQRATLQLRKDFEKDKSEIYAPGQSGGWSIPSGGRSNYL